MTFKYMSCDITHVKCIERDLSHIGYIPTWLKSRRLYTNVS